MWLERFEIPLRNDREPLYSRSLELLATHTYKKPVTCTDVGSKKEMQTSTQHGAYHSGTT
jgi:hypothetical protein